MLKRKDLEIWQKYDSVDTWSISEGTQHKVPYIQSIPSVILEN